MHASPTETAEVARSRWCGGISNITRFRATEARLKAYRNDVLRMWFANAPAAEPDAAADVGSAFGKASAACYHQSRSCTRIRPCASTPNMPVSKVRTVCVSSASTGSVRGAAGNRRPYRDPQPGSRDVRFHEPHNRKIRASGPKQSPFCDVSTGIPSAQTAFGEEPVSFGESRLAD